MRGAVVASKGRACAEALDVGGLGHELGGGQRATAQQVKQCGCQRLDQVSKLALERVNGLAELPNAAQQITGQARHGARQRRQALLEAAQHVLVIERRRGRGSAWHELVQMPAQPVLHPRTFGYQILTMGDQQAHLAFRAFQSGNRQVRLAQCRAGDCQRIDRIRFTHAPPGTPRIGHQPRWHAHHPLTSSQQIGLQGAREVPTILNGPHAVGPLGCPTEHFQVPARAGGYRALR
jgi:hypothetical protein